MLLVVDVGKSEADESDGQHRQTLEAATVDGGLGSTGDRGDVAADGLDAREGGAEKGSDHEAEDQVGNVLLDGQVTKQDGEADGRQHATGNGEAGAEPGEVAVEGAGDGVNQTLAEGEGEEDRDHTGEAPRDSTHPVVNVVGVPVHLLDVGVAGVTPEGVGHTTEDVGVDEDRGHGHAEGGEGLLRVHAGAHGEGRSDEGAGVGVDAGSAAEGANAEDGELHATTDEKTSCHVAHDEARDEAGEHGGAGAGVPVQLVHDLEARIEREQKNLPPLNHGSFPPSNNSNVTCESRYMVAVHLPSPRSAVRKPRA